MSELADKATLVWDMSGELDQLECRREMAINEMFELFSQRVRAICRKPKMPIAWSVGSLTMHYSHGKWGVVGQVRLEVEEDMLIVSEKLMKGWQTLRRRTYANPDKALERFAELAMNPHMAIRKAMT